MAVITKSLRLLTIQYELAMLVGRSLDLKEMLGLFLSKTLLYLNCTCGHIWLLNNETKLLEHMHSYPRATPKQISFLQKIIKGLNKNDIKCHTSQISGRKFYSYFIPIGSIGIAVIQSNYKPLSRELLEALKPIFNRLELACYACLQYGIAETSYHDLFEYSPISLLEEDFSAVKNFLTKLQASGTSDIDRYFASHPEEMEKCLSMIKITNTNQAMLKMYNLPNKKSVTKEFTKIFRDEASEIIRKNFVAFSNNEKFFKKDTITYTLDNKKLYTTILCSVMPGHENTYKKVLVSITDISDLKYAEKQLDYQAKHDSLTGLPNRFLFNTVLNTAINHAKHTHQPMAVLYLDLDHFKIINDTIGHHIGDLLLEQVAKKLQKIIRTGDFVARMGGDEFAVILNNLIDAHDAGKVAEKINNIIAGQYKLAEHRANITVSIGIACYPCEGDNSSDLIKNADIALYAAKEKGRNTYQYFSLDLGDYPSEQLCIKKALNHALKRGEFYLVYQPKFSLPSKKMVGVEALIRWRHPDLGIIPPDKFIPIAEAMGQIVSIGEWVVKTACQQYKIWFPKKNTHQQLMISLNVSPRQLAHRELFDLIKNTVKQTKILPENLELELTETAIMANPEVSARTLAQLHDVGIRISIDDFGAGYSSLAYIKRLPMSTLKIDKSFIHEIETNHNDAAIVKAIINLAKNFDLNVIAEGVETKAQLQFLTDNGCYEAQGFYFAEPLDAQEMTKFIKEYSRDKRKVKSDKN